MNTPLPSNEFLDDLDIIRARMTSVKTILTDPKITSIRLVLNPEKMVINETKRAFTYLCLYNLTVECLIVNRLISEEMKSLYPAEKWAEQQKYMDLIDESFNPLTMLRSNMFKTEVFGRDKLDILADNIFGSTDPTRIFTTEKAMTIYRENGLDILSLKLPFSTKDEVELYKAADVLIVKVGWYKRSVSLPYSLVSKDATKAEFKDGRLLIRFEEVKKHGKEEGNAR
jgi:arsenite-transporting ATPase